MKDKIKEKLLKEIEEFFINENFDCSVEDFLSKTKKEIEIDLKSIEDFELKSQYVSLKTGYYLAIEETSKAKDEEFIKILDELASCIGNISVSDSLEKLDFVYLRKSEIDEANRKLIKAKEKIQNLKEKEE